MSDPGTESVAPDLITAVIGFRQWRLIDGELWPLRAPDRWGPGVQTAHCERATHPGPAPANGCTCGIHAWYEPPPRGASAATPDLVAGAVALWGLIELHAHGMRAEHAVVVALALPFSRGAKRRGLEAVGARRGVPVVPARHLRATALRSGAPIPPAMRPPDLEPNKRKAPGPPAPARLRAVADGYSARSRSRR